MFVLMLAMPVKRFKKVTPVEIESNRCLKSAEFARFQ